MARRDGTRPQVDFPQLIADVIDQLNVRGPLGVLDLSDQVIPAFIIGSRAGSLQVTVTPVNFASAAVFHGASTTPAANTVIVDTGALPAGDYDVLSHISSGANLVATAGVCILEHRNAANAATLATLLSVSIAQTSTAEGPNGSELPLIGYTLALNERLRVVSPAFNVNAGSISASIFAQRRVAP